MTSNQLILVGIEARYTGCKLGRLTYLVGPYIQTYVEVRNVLPNDYRYKDKLFIFSPREILSITTFNISPLQLYYSYFNSSFHFVPRS